MTVRGPISKPVMQARPKQTKMQFSKKQAVFADVLVVVIWTGEFVLRALGMEGVGDVAIAIVTAYGAFATGGYFALAGARDCSKNKHAHYKNIEGQGES